MSGERTVSAETGQPAMRGTWLDADAAQRLHARAGAARWGQTVDRFHETLARVAVRRFTGPAPSPREVESYLETLHLEDLALARGCAEGLDVAWEAFVERHWRDVTRAARAIAGDADGEEIADALLADLFARGEAGSPRRPLFDYFHGRSRLATWLRALISQRHIDRLRATKRLTSFEDGEAESWPSPEPSPEDQPAVIGGHVERALDRALAALEPRDRLRLAYYHADDLTLAAVGRLLGEHEATVSRKLQKTRDHLKAAIDAVLTTELRLGPDERKACYEQAIQFGRFDIARLKVDGAGPAGPTGPDVRPAPADARGRKVSPLTRSRERDGTR
ncbi:MAG: sigma-70 family RNA polymerase sigma factor [Vicinamibacteraceae bacterium]